MDKIKNISVPSPNPAQDGGKYLQYNGTEYVLSTISGSSGGTVTSVIVSPPLSVKNGSTTPNLTISQASGGSSGYLAASDFLAFSNKQAAITVSSTIHTGTITTAQQIDLNIAPYGDTAGNTGELRLSELAAGGTEYVGFKAPDGITASKIWTLPAVDGSDGQVLKTNGAGLLSWTSGLAPTGAAGGDLENNYPNPTVTKVGGVSAANIASGANTANAATAAGTPSTLVARDGSGNFTAGTITATLNGNASTATTATNVSGVVGIANGGTNATTIAAARTNLGAAASGANSDITALSGLTTPLSVSQGGTGAATALPLTVFAGPSTGSSAGAPVFRALVAGDIPDLSVSKITSGILPITQGGTGLSAPPTSGQILIGNGSGYNLGSLVAGTNITVGNGTGAITISAADDANKVTKSGDTMTGTLTLPSNGLVAGGSQLVLANGNVGIGNTVPYTLLSLGAPPAVSGLSYEPNSLSLTHPSPASDTALNDPRYLLYLNRPGTSNVTWGPTAAFAISRYEHVTTFARTRLDLALTHNSSGDLQTRVTFLSNGNVGIGTTQPGQNLDIVGNTQVSGRSYTSGTSGTAGQGYFTGTAATPLGAFQTVNVNNNTHTFFGTNKYYTGSGWADMGLSRVGSSFQITNDAFTFFSFDTGATFTPRFTVASGGNVGIGTTNPSATLTIVGTTSVSGNSTIGGNVDLNGGRLSFGAAGQSMINVSALNPGATSSAAIISGPLQQHLILDLNNNDADDAIAFRYSQANNFQVDSIDFVMKGNGNVGIGTTAPTTKLEVAGVIKSTSGGFVFPDGSTLTTAAPKSFGTGGGAAATPSSGCPTGYILVPGDTDYGTTDFCVMKYEAKFGDKGAESRVTGLPARGTISQNTALAACRNLGPGYALINNAEWMTIAANVANVSSNWSGGAVGSGALNRGHSDNDPALPLAASTDNDPCNGTGQTCSDNTWNDQRRTHKLSNNNVIWDLAGNVWEWVDYNNYEDKPTPATAAWTEYTGVTGSTTMAKTSMVPSQVQKSWWNNSWNGATNGIGQYYAGTNSSGVGRSFAGAAGTTGRIPACSLRVWPMVRRSRARALASAVSSGPPAPRSWVPWS